MTPAELAGILDGVEKVAATRLQKEMRRVVPELKGGVTPDRLSPLVGSADVRGPIARKLRELRAAGMKEKAKKLRTMAKAEYGKDIGGIRRPHAGDPISAGPRPFDIKMYPESYRKKMLARRRRTMSRAMPEAFGQGVS